MANVIIYSIYAKLKQSQYTYITENAEKNLLPLIKELKEQLSGGNEIVLTKMIGKDAVNLLKLLP